VQPLQQRAGFDAQLADQRPAQPLERRQCLGLAPGPVQGVHAQPDQPLPQRVFPADTAQRRQHVQVPAGEDPDVRPVFDRGEPPLGQVREQRLDDRAEFHAVERRAAPQRQRLLQQVGRRVRGAVRGGPPGPRGEPVEDQHVQVVGAEVELVSGWPRGEAGAAVRVTAAVRADQPADGGRVGADRARRRAGCPHRPQRLGQPFHRHRAAGVQ
jgi:hypothetical protein